MGNKVEMKNVAEGAPITGYSVARSLRWENGELYILDQTRLPNEVVEECEDSVQMVWDAIKQLKVRGATAIGIAGAYGLVIAQRDFAGIQACRPPPPLKHSPQGWRIPWTAAIT